MKDLIGRPLQVGVLVRLAVTVTVPVALLHVSYRLDHLEFLPLSCSVWALVVEIDKLSSDVRTADVALRIGLGGCLGLRAG